MICRHEPWPVCLLSALDHLHLRLVVVTPRRRCEFVQPLHLISLSTTSSAATFSSSRATRRVPGIGAMSSPFAKSQAIAT